ncbi:MAG: LLM class flavin-dependent oxidoreductase [Chloroflexi bacterium]|nr:LLM class flavin-dependent oxidoreductase [Chloroflexota bacterium]
MRLGLSLHLLKTLGERWETAYDELVWSARYADAQGFMNIWMVEHHFMETSTAAPGMVLAHLAAITHRVRLGYSVALLPFHHPLRLAEEMLLLDRLSHGRADLGVGRGHTPLEVATLCPAPEQAVALFNDAVRIIQLAFQGEPFRFQGEYWSFPEVQLFPPPVQRHPILWMPITSPRSIAFAAEHGLAPLLGNRPLEELQATLAEYTRALQAAGHAEERVLQLLDRAAVTRVCIVADTAREAEAIARYELAQYHHNFVLNGVPVGDPRFPRYHQEWPPLEDPLETLLYRRALFGTADEVIDQLRELERLGIRQVTVGLGSYATPAAERRRRLIRLSKQVLPRVQHVRLAS